VALRLYNTRTRTVEPFAPLSGRRVRMYVCGLTPSAEAHLGHARSFLFFDVLNRYLEHCGYDVLHVRNVTDIDDRSIARGLETGEPWQAIVEGHFASFARSMHRMDVRDPDEQPRATAYIPQIIGMIAELIAIDHAYATEDGIYYRVKSFARYGALSNRNVDELLIGARIAVDEHKHDALDFALWKFVKPGEPSWESPWGAGRPGWHIECSAMSRALLGEPFDIHGGGFDLIFPHHENEIAQSEALMPQPPMANVWVHGGLLMFDGRKMSKSLGNFEPLSQLLDRHDPLALRLLFLQTGYRKPMNFTEASVTGSTTALERLRTAYHTLRAGENSANVEPFRERFIAALDDDMNTAGAVSVLFDLAREPFSDDVDATRAFMREALGILGIGALLDRAEAPASTVDPAIAGRLAAAVGDAVALAGSSPEAAIDAVISARNAARKSRDFALADRLRQALAAENIVLNDNKDGTTGWTLGA
jgi:cysteinyl-tRNA synthetase